jgi:DNA polymerase-4
MALMSAHRKIIHADCDCFYASIETRDNPELRGLPIAVGGSPQRRGVVATCNYEARKFGIHSAMPMVTALRKCPSLIVIAPRMDKYREASASVHAIFRRYTTLIEPLSLDEAYLDVTHAKACQGSATLIAQEIREQVKKEVGISISTGIAPNKFVAKVASDWNKPDGQFVVTPEQVDAFVSILPVQKLHGVGKVTAARLHNMNIHTCADLRTCTRDALFAHFGSFGTTLYSLCRGIDERPVSPNRIRKSLSVENTFAEDLPDLAACIAQLPALHKQLLTRLQSLESAYAINKNYVKLRFRNFVSTTVETLSSSSHLDNYIQLCGEAYVRGQLPVRLVGIGVHLSSLAQSESGTGKIPASAQLQLALESKS